MKNEYLAGGLSDGVVKIWDLKKKDVVRLFKPTTHSSSPVTSLSFNSSNTLVAASNSKGSINFFPMADLFNKDKPNEFVPTISVGEVLSLKALDA